MSRTRALLLVAPAMVLAGLILFVIASPRAGRAAQEGLDEYETPRTFQLWVCPGATTCKPVGRPMNATACALDLASMANASPPGTKLRCQRITTGGAR